MPAFINTEEGDATVDITYIDDFATGGTGESAVCRVVLAASADGTV